MINVENAPEHILRDVLVSSRFFKNFLGGRLVVGGEVSLCQGFLPLLVTFAGMTFASSSCSSSSSLPLFPPRCSTSSSSSPNTFSLFPLPLVHLALPLFIPGLGPGFLREQARGGLLYTALPTSLSLGSDSLTSSKAACRSASS